jgi:hypothetical protein
VDLGELDDERKSLARFLRTVLKVEVASDDNSISIDSEKLSPEELKRLVNRFIYHQNLNNKYWVMLEGSVVKINKFKGAEKHKKRKKKAAPPSTIKHGW